MIRRMILMCLILCLISSGFVLKGFYTGERVSGMFKFCYYDCPTGEVVITVGVTDVCPSEVDCP